MKKYRIFISYDRTKDQFYRDQIENIYTSVSMIQSLEVKEFESSLNNETIRRKIREKYLQDSVITIVLIGKDTWKRKQVDWEISSSLSDTDSNPRNGLIGIILPTHSSYEQDQYNPCSFPPRFYDNVSNGYAEFYDWSIDRKTFKDWVKTALETRAVILPNNSRSLFHKNRGSNREGWC